MRDLYLQHYQELDYIELVHILEYPEGYIPEVLTLCKRLLEQKDISAELKMEEARKFYVHKFLNYFNEGNHWQGASISLESHFLTEDEMKDCFEYAKEVYIHYRNGATNGLF